jgi:hypothetical protein
MPQEPVSCCCEFVTVGCHAVSSFWDRPRRASVFEIQVAIAIHKRQRLSPVMDATRGAPGNLARFAE